MARAGTLKSNTRSRNTVNIRYEPDGETIKTERAAGTRVRVTAETGLRSGYRWYKVGYGSSVEDVGWVREDVIMLDSEASSPPLEDYTRLYFETRTQSIRIFLEAGTPRLNLYDKVSNKTLLSRANAIYLPRAVSAPTGSETSWRGYLAQQSGKVYIARFVPLQQTELIISQAAHGNVLSQERGFSSRGTEYTERP